jgi:protein O-mannosyl-transferase
MLRRPIGIGRVFAITGCFLLALLTKEQGMLFPLLLGFFAIGLWINARRAGRPITLTPLERRSLPWLVLLLCWILAAYVYLREHVLPLKFWWDRTFLDWTINPMIHAEGLDRAMMPLVLLGRYTQLLVAPWRMSIDYGGSVIGWSVRSDDPYLYLGAGAVVAWFIATIIAWRLRDGIAVFALLALAATYGIVGNIVTLIGTNFGERLMYIPSIFFILLVSWWLMRLPRRAVVVIASIVLLLASVRTVSYAARWTDRLALYEYSLEQQPRSIRIHMLVISELQSRGRLEEAEQSAARAREVEPQYWSIWVQSALIAMELGKFDEAEAFLTRAMELSPQPGIAAMREDIPQRRAEREEK